MDQLSHKAKDPVKLDEEFIKIMKQVERCYDFMTRHDKVKVEHWTKKLCQVTSNVQWKQNRNLYGMLLLDMLLAGSLTEPFNKMPADGPLPILNKQLLKFKTLQRKLSEGNLAKAQTQRTSTTPLNNHQLNSRTSKRDTSEERARETKAAPRSSSNKELYGENSGRKKLMFRSEAEDVPKFELRYSYSSDEEPLRERKNQNLPGKENIDCLKHRKNSDEGVWMKGNEENLKQELKIKDMQIEELLKEIKTLKNENLSIKMNQTTLIAFATGVKQKIEAETAVAELNKLCEQLKFPPITVSPRIVDKFCVVSEKKSVQNYQLAANSSGSKLKRDSFYEYRTQRDNPDNFDHILPTSHWPELQNTPGSTKKESVNMDLMRKSVGNSAKVNRFSADIEINQRREEYSRGRSMEGLRKPSFSRFLDDPRKSEITQKWSQRDRENADFFAYLDEFQQETEKIKQEHRDLMKRIGNYGVMTRR